MLTTTIITHPYVLPSISQSTNSPSLLIQFPYTNNLLSPPNHCFYISPSTFSVYQLTAFIHPSNCHFYIPLSTYKTIFQSTNSPSLYTHQTTIFTYSYQPSRLPSLHNSFNLPNYCRHIPLSHSTKSPFFISHT